ncbi:MAG TPA: hypothetical protein VIZ32_06860, partial [Vicinamibacterales bacterium]
GAPVPPILPPQDGYLFLDRTKFRASFAADVSADAAAFMADSQVPWGLEALNGAVSEPAWRTKPSWYLVSTDDRMTRGFARTPTTRGMFSSRRLDGNLPQNSLERPTPARPLSSVFS